MLEILIISLVWLFILLAWKSYKDNVIKYHKKRVSYLEERLRRNNVYYETEEL